MSWQRIDENTYIDDTLVTCMEFELFIDEMREQGKYYQPDHWASYQFPAGQAREPILGVRQADAEAFCEWLTKRDEKKWNFRLPTVIDVGEYPCKQNNNGPIGYWVVSERNNYEFYWIGSKRVDIIDLQNNILRLTDAPYWLEPGNDVLAQMKVIATVFADSSPLYNFSLSRSQEHRTSELLRIMNIVIKAGPLPNLTKTEQRLRSELLINCVAILIIDGRAANKNPAFEGIRLVKERTR